MSQEEGSMDLYTWLSEHYPPTNIDVEPTTTKLEANTWKEIRLFLSSTFIDTQAERDVLIKRVIPSVNRKLAPRFIRITPVDLRWGVLKEESKDCEAIQKTCLNQLDRCRQQIDEYPWFLGLRTARYGWVQDKITKSQDFDKPERYGWIDKFNEYNKHVSITSLECIHASLPSAIKTNEPTVFFYRREITNSNEIEDDLRWVFDFEYVAEDAELEPNVQFQYTKTKSASIYKEDKENLDKYLEGLDHVTYSTYKCCYEKGGARFTSKNEDEKSFGVGYVSGLNEFEKQVEEDLLHAIEKNFVETDMSNIPKHIHENIPYENAIKQKASTFVGRLELIEQCYQYCASKEVDDSVTIIHGEPGCGKSALLAAVSKRCLDDLRERENFVFVHAVDSCPGSNNLELMLRRLRVNLRKYCDRDDDEEKHPKSAAELKSEHVKFVEKSAAKYPNKLFVIMIDAVNQFYDSLQSWSMWWLPSKDAPSNLRVIISTLNEENGTFKNACERCPRALKVEVGAMSRDDGAEMVSTTLAKFNKKLTTDETNTLLGNQMKHLLDKSLSPLYLMVATQALRRFGIYEEVTKYIRNLPNDISKLFRFLLEEWTAEYGKLFTQDVTGFLCISKDGLLENEINDILSFKESEEGSPYGCSFSRIYDSLCDFLAAGGGGFLRFFHDQLKYAVKEMFLTPELEHVLHLWLVKFYLHCIRPQLCEAPGEEPPAYYQHCLQQVVYHQLQIVGTNKQTGDFVDTLRNIYFIRDRVFHQQEDFLHQEYVNAIRKSTNDDERKSLKEWTKFTHLYYPYIRMYPESSYDMAMNQSPTSYVAMDTSMLPKPAVLYEGYPYYWSNMSSAEDYVVSKYTSDQSVKCVASEPGRNLCCIGTVDGKAFLYELDSGVLIHQVSVYNYVTSVYLSDAKYNTFWVGSDIYVSIWSIDTGTEEWRLNMRGTKRDIIASIGEDIVCVTGRKEGDSGLIFMVDQRKREVIKTWSTELVCFCYCYHGDKNLILSGHEDVIRCWSLEGHLLKDIQVGDKYEVQSLSVNPSADLISFVLEEKSSRNSEVKQLNFSTEEVICTIPNAGDLVLYDNTGERILCKNKGSIMVYGLDGILQNKLNGNSSEIKDLSFVPGAGDLLTATRDGSMLFTIPTSSDHKIGEEVVDEVITWCDFLPSGEEFATLSSKKLEIWNTSSCKRRISVDIKVWHAYIHPDGNYILVSTPSKLQWVNTVDMQTVATYDVFDKKDDSTILDIKISPNGLMCVVVTDGEGAIVFDITNVNDIKETVRHKMEKGFMMSCDVHQDNVQVVSGSATFDNEGGVDVWDISTGVSTPLRENKDAYWVKFLYQPDRVIYVDKSGRVCIIDMTGVEIITIDSKVNSQKPALTLLRNGTQLMTSEKDNTICVRDIFTGKILYTFVHHRSLGFKCFLVYPLHDIIRAYNENRMCYVLKNSK